MTEGVTALKALLRWGSYSLQPHIHMVFVAEGIYQYTTGWYMLPALLGLRC